MTTLKGDHSPNFRCTCPPQVEGPSVGAEENCAATTVLSARTPLVGTQGPILALQIRP